eukprot:TRINITY_DN31720_c0_g1_i1.p1 TRINITY_DN31720_c0_g1~~TRINITY_DN31720_c0_g1_i1.p1  ORF type:complete len:145 (-),score=27.80 TRINITY_DN31720_c0_g1_i1:344-778(-)
MKRPQQEHQPLPESLKRSPVIRKHLKKLSNSSRKSIQAEDISEDVSSEEDEPPVTRSRRSASSKIIENGDNEQLIQPSRTSGSSRISSTPITDVYSDDEELLSVSARPSTSSKFSKKLSISSRISNLISGNSDDGESNNHQKAQ